MGRGLGRVEERVAHPHLDDVLDTQARVFEQMGGLSIDLEGAPIVEKIEIKAPINISVYQTTTGMKDGKATNP